MNEHAILIFAYDKPQQLAKLVKSLRHPRLDVYIHIDQKHYGQFLDHTKIIQNDATVISTQRVNYCGFSFCKAILDLILLAIDRKSYATFSSISGTDYPIKNTEYIVSVLDETKCSRIDYWRDEDPSWHKRYKRFYFYDSPFARPLNAASRRLARILPDRKPPHNITIFFGWPWCTLTYEGAKAIVEFANERPDVVKFFRHVHIPDESFFQTALVNANSKPPLLRKPLRYIKFPNASMHPKTLTFDDLEDIFSSDAIFARKFDEKRSPGSWLPAPLLDTARNHARS